MSTRPRNKKYEVKLNNIYRTLQKNKETKWFNEETEKSTNEEIKPILKKDQSPNKQECYLCKKNNYLDYFHNKTNCTRFRAYQQTEIPSPLMESDSDDYKTFPPTPQNDQDDDNDGAVLAESEEEEDQLGFGLFDNDEPDPTLNPCPGPSHQLLMQPIGTVQGIVPHHQPPMQPTTPPEPQQLQIQDIRPDGQDKVEAPQEPHTQPVVDPNFRDPPQQDLEPQVQPPLAPIPKFIKPKKGDNIYYYDTSTDGWKLAKILSKVQGYSGNWYNIQETGGEKCSKELTIDTVWKFQDPAKSKFYEWRWRDIKDDLDSANEDDPYSQ